MSDRARTACCSTTIASGYHEPWCPVRTQPKEIVPDLVEALAKLGLHATGEKVLGHPVGLGLAALFAATLESDSREAAGLPRILVRAADLIRGRQSK